MKPKLAFVSLWDAGNRNAESGYAYSMRLQLQKRFDVVDLFPLALRGERWWLPVRAAYKVGGRYYHPMREPAVLKPLARRIERELGAVKPDAIFAPSSMPLSYVENPRPRIFATDQVFGDFVETYIRQPAARFRRLGDAQERRALATAACASFPSEWAAQSAIGRYGADAGRLAVIPWGGNLPRAITDEEVAAAIPKRRLDQCHLIFLGRDWRRKGGDRLVATVAALNRMGLTTHATIVGCDPPNLPAEHFTIHPFLDKGRPEHFAVLASSMLAAHFLFLPSRAEAYGQAFCEAAAFGVPVIGSTAGGIPTIIRDGETGFLRPAETSGEDFAALIHAALTTPGRYAEMAREARDDYRRRLNWDRFGERLSEAITALI